MPRKQNRRGRSKKQGHASSHKKWLREITSGFKPTVAVTSSGEKAMMVIYNTSIPPRMPAPGGPSKGAQLTTTQFVRLSDMTLPTGGAVVGALLRQSSSTDVFASFAFALADVPNISSLGALFDQYRVEEIQFRIRSRNPGVFVANQASPNYSTVAPLLVVDRDDNTAPATLLELQQYDNCVQFAAQDSIDVIFKPSITPSVFSGGAFSGYAVDESGKYWLDVANTSIPHYGIKMGFPALVATTTQRFDWDCSAIYKISFKNIR